MFSGIHYNLFLDTSICRVSIDSLRIKFTLPHDSAIDDLSVVDSWAVKFGKFVAGRWADFNYQTYDPFIPQFDFAVYESTFKIGSYAYTYKVFNDIEQWSFAILLGRYSFENGKKIEPEFVLDINPNKVPIQILSLIFKFIALPDRCITICRYDVAFDYAISRSDIMLFKNPRKSYKRFETKTGLTEYQGTRNNHGAIKVYDKTKESDLEIDVTRVEITIDGDFSDSIVKLFPDIGVVGNEQLDLEFNNLPFPVKACILHPDLVELLNSYERHTKAKYLEMIKSYQPFTLIPSDFSAIDLFIKDSLYAYLHPLEKLCSLMTEAL